MAMALVDRVGMLTLNSMTVNTTKVCCRWRDQPIQILLEANSSYASAEITANTSTANTRPLAKSSMVLTLFEPLAVVIVAPATLQLNRK
jgi:hypothetical protein